MLKKLSLVTLGCLFAMGPLCHNLYGSTEEPTSTSYESSIPIPINLPTLKEYDASIPIPINLPQTTVGSIPIPINLPITSIDTEATIPVWLVQEKVYLDPAEIELSEEGIFVLIDDHLLEIDGLQVDQGGIYAFAGGFRCLGCRRPVNTKYICENSKCAAYDSP